MNLELIVVKIMISNDLVKFLLTLFYSLLFGNLFVYFKFKGVTVITADMRTTLFIVLTTLGVIGTLLMVGLRKPPASTTTNSDR